MCDYIHNSRSPKKVIDHSIACIITTDRMDALTSTQPTANTERIPLVLTYHSTNGTGRKIT